jgi:hypothetical protein
MRRAIVIAIVVAVGTTLSATSFAGSKQTATETFKATLNASQVVPHPKGATANATGTFSATLTGTILKWKPTFSHLTGSAVAAHVHLGARGKNGIALIALCGPCTSPVRGTANSVTDDEAALMAKGGAYVNVHTNKNPEGEIRGELTGH